MGYTLKIGEAVVEWSEDLVRIGAESVCLDSAPAFNEPTDYTNSRWPLYSSWANFCREMDLMDVMFNERNGGRGSFLSLDSEHSPLIVSHPGAEPITKAHLEYIERKIAAYKAAHPDHRAEYPPPVEGAKPIVGDIYREEDYVKDPRYDGNLCRAEWLLFWMRWAIQNCKHPVFVNS